MKRFWFVFLLSIVACLLLWWSFYLALQQRYTDWNMLHLVNASLTGMMAMLSAVAAGLFLYSMRNFKQELRWAYILLCIGILLFGLAQLQFPVARYFNAVFWYAHGFIGILYLIAVAFIFLGVRKIATILQLHSRWISFKWVLGSGVVVAIGVAFLPHAHYDHTSFQIGSSNALSAFDAVFLTFATMATWRIHQSIGPRYKRAMAWLAIAFGANVIAGIHYIIVNLVVPDSSAWYFNDAMSAEPFFIASLILVYAGYVMVMIDRTEDAALKRMVSRGALLTPQGLPLVDIITYVASLASQPQEVDQKLDTLRFITARLQPGEQLSTEDQRQLLSVYRDIEHYLVTDEPLRIFTITEIRQRLAKEFKLTTTAIAQLRAS